MCGVEGGGEKKNFSSGLQAEAPGVDWTETGVEWVMKIHINVSQSAKSVFNSFFSPLSPLSTYCLRRRSADVKLDEN